MLFFSFLIALFSVVQVITASTVHSGASVQLFEWSWNDVAYECENFLSKKGYKAVQVSPPTDHIQGSQWWTRYQPVTYKLISRSGNETQFDDMVSRCTKAGVKVVVDAVINHMAAGSGTSLGGSSYGNRQYPSYSQNDFHHDSNNPSHNCEVTNYADKYNVQYCDLVGLPDLATSSSYVQSQIVAYIKNLYNKGVRGVRIDAAKHQDATELGAITKQLPSDMWVGQEVIYGSGEAVTPSMYYGNGYVSEFQYPTFLDPNIINENKMVYLSTFGESWGLMPDKYAVAFIDNHDTQRGGAQLTYKNGNLYTFANVFMLSFPYGEVRVMSSYYFSNSDQGPPSVGVNGGANCNDGKNWVCEHRWTPIANMVAWRNSAGTSDVANWQNGNANQIAFSRGGKAFIAFNRGSSTWSATLQTGLPAGTYCNVYESDDTSSCSTVTVGSDGKASVNVSGVSAVALHVGKKK